MKLLWTFILIIATAEAVKDYLFKTCAQSGFCHRNRHYAKAVLSAENFESPYRIESVTVDNGIVNGVAIKELTQLGRNVNLPFEITIVEDNFRFKLNEERVGVQLNHINPNRYNETEKWSFKPNVTINTNVDISEKQNELKISYGKHEVIIQYNPIVFVFNYKGKEQLRINADQFLNVEHYRTQQENELHMLAQESSFDMFSDSFPDSKMDTLPLGPESVAVDFKLMGFSHMYGIPEHSDSLLLKDTTDKEPYRLFNVDIFEYEIDSRLPMYGSIPLLVAIKPEASVGIFWVNAADTYIDIKRDKDSTVHWISENGVLDFIVIIEDTPVEVTQQFGRVTGFVQLPPLFSLGYHQCRWNYNDEKDVLDVHAKFDEHHIPYDTIWLDIEYTDSKKYFTWDKEKFPDPARMCRILDYTARHLTVIIDPHFKTEYNVTEDMVAKDLEMKSSKGEPFKGHCWPGESVWLDPFNPESQDWWTQRYKDFLPKDAKNIHIWNDMNEPSVFNGPETSSPKDTIHFGGWEHRSVHNIYGLNFHERSYNALIERTPEERPFVLTRSLFAGSQRTAASWSGDIQATWEHLKATVPMMLSMNIVGAGFTGADVGGFFGDPSPELLLRWYQVGIWYPFFRGHAHIDTKRREPWLVADVAEGIADAIRLRYKLLPIWYTAFYEASSNGIPIVSPIFWSDGKDITTYETEDQFTIGDSGLLVKPLASDDGSKLPSSEVYYNFTGGALSGIVNGFGHGVDVLLRGGSIVPVWGRQRRSTSGSVNDPYTIYIGLNGDGIATGKLYRDDTGLISFKVENDVLSATPSVPKIEKIVVINSSGQKIQIKKPRFESSKLEFHFPENDIEHDEL
ncbi:conserved hypothetical protein [Candida tropicalis MYA-3404]|uniref:Glucosidase II subunit alpha n=1 Tax=Candida tropicalis (strain ATCC MYA-3404 / T1) TaxID=294747 RepID=C5MGP0_CANTT|nr:conserved hypothetical protein [Candida tropicalis MYA-3404]EER30792.1 conserved hypothetical protein [Candida tropicalis MYA-3404]KAG4404349.1 hypothetical protein JTP64_006101 [Candida tropicalis]